MREYRAWHVGFKRFVVITGLHYFGGGKLSGISFDDPELGEQQDIPVKWFILTQYTGLKDKHRKKIFKGDIIKHEVLMSEGRTREKVQGEVFYKEGCFWVKDKIYRGNLMSGGLGYKRLSEVTNTEDFLKEFRCEIIGNIHENPELLTERNQNAKETNKT